MFFRINGGFNVNFGFGKEPEEDEELDVSEIESEHPLGFQPNPEES